MNELYAAKLFHNLGVIGWVGGLFMVGWVLAMRDTETDPAFKTKMGVMARRLAMVADVGATLVIAAGIFILVKRRAELMHQGYMHIKFALLVVLLGFHGLIRVKAKKASQGEGTFPRLILQALVVLVGAILYIVIFKPLAK
jgi:protoporphyrinogen IX oxidase